MSGAVEKEELSTFEKLCKEAVSFIVTIGSLVALAFLVIRPTLLEPFQIPSGSMIPTLEIGDRILVNKLSYGLRIAFMDHPVIQWSQPERGEVVVFTRPDDPRTKDNEGKINLIKRVVGLPGETIELRDDTVYINGKVLDEQYARYVDGGIAEGNFGPEAIPEGHILLLGDNRDRSKDSRFWDKPFLDIRRIKGRAFMVYWSWNDLSRIATIIR